MEKPFLGEKAYQKKELRFSFSTNFSLKKKPLLKKNPFLAQVLSLERKCFVKRKSVLMCEECLMEKKLSGRVFIIGEYDKI